MFDPDSPVRQDRELQRMTLTLMSADQNLARGSPLPHPVDVPLTALWGTTDEFVSRDDVAGWKQCSSASFTLEALKGTLLP